MATRRAAQQINRATSSRSAFFACAPHSRVPPRRRQTTQQHSAAPWAPPDETLKLFCGALKRPMGICRKPRGVIPDYGIAAAQRTSAADWRSEASRCCCQNHTAILSPAVRGRWASPVSAARPGPARGWRSLRSLRCRSRCSPSYSPIHPRCSVFSSLARNLVTSCFRSCTMGGSTS